MKDKTERTYHERLILVINYIFNNLDAALTLEELSDTACFSPYHFHRIFKGILGESVKELIRRLRMERSAIELHNTQDSILIIAQRAGYESDMAFSRAFRKMTSLSPSKFRNTPNAIFPCLANNGIRYDTTQRITHFTPAQNEGMTMNVVIKELEPMRVACVRHTGPYSSCGEAWERLLAELGPNGYLGGQTKLLGICYDDPDATPPEEIRYDACVSVPKEFTPESPLLRLADIEGGRYAMTTHIGPYDRLNETYQAFCGTWLKTSGYEAANKPCLEFYLNDPESTEPEDLVTDIYLPLEKE